MTYPILGVHRLTKVGDVYHCRHCGKGGWTSVVASSHVPCEPPITKVTEEPTAPTEKTDD